MTTISNQPTKVPVNQHLSLESSSTGAPPASSGVPTPAPAPRAFPPLPPLPPPANVGRFGTLPTVDNDVAQLLRELEQLPGVWGPDAANFIFNEISNRNLRGIVRASNARKIVSVRRTAS